ncbi:DUF262 domain-containing protein [Mesomycoplasma molare]|uniref:DUF262 domain-containing protein n=1 Tax=Mesomycoplasma molare TaxID=171288 RepID=A0ABY5TUR1_9BACT|nr:DUF262 domain-containing protein [Mesomycoplasma molare]UWD34392.1 DUF262 domain-containing protein [Mesomycoplasma molare]
MNKSLDKWQENLKAIGCIEWTIGTDVYSYLKKSIFRWFDRIDYEDHIVYKDYEKDNENKKKIYFITKPDIVFYDSSKLYQSYSTIRQLLDVLNSLSILEKNQDKISITKELFSQEYKEYDIEYILPRFIIKNLETSLNKFIIEKLKNISFNNDWKNEDLNFTKFWWNVLIELDKTEVLDGKLKGFFPFIAKAKKNFYFNNFVKEIIINNINQYDELKKEVAIVFENFFTKVKEITGLYNTQWKKYIIFPKDFNNLDIDNYDRENLLDKKIKEHDSNNFFVIKSNILDIFTSRDLKYDLPLFQRTYSWDSNIIIGLFETIFSDYKNSFSYQNYTLLNNIILGQYKTQQIIIDGQQRITSIILILISLFRLANHKEDKMSINILKYPLKKVESMIKNFTNSDKNYLVLKYIFNGNETSITNFSEDIEKSFHIVKQTRFIKNSDEIYNLVTKKFLEDNESLYGFVTYLLENVFLIITYIPNLDNKKVTKIFQNINQYSKKLGVLDLIRNKLYEKYSHMNRVYYIIERFNETINLFFRKKMKADKDEDLKLFLNFLENILIKNKKINEIDYIDNNYHDSISNSFEKFNLLFNIYDENKNENILLNFWKDILEFEYAKTGYINNCIEILKNTKYIQDDIKTVTEEFKNKIDDYKIVNFQIFHIAHGGSKTVFIQLILILMESLNLFRQPDNKISEKQMILFSKYLAYIERFSALWKIKFLGQSLTQPIRNIIKKNFINSGKLLEPKELGKKLEEMIKEIQAMTEGEKVTELYENLTTSFINIKNNEDSNYEEQNILYKIILGKVFYSLKIKDKKNPMFFGGYSSEEQKSLILDYLPYSYEHSLPRNMKKEDKEKLTDINVNEEEIQSVIKQIGNGCLLLKKDNSKVGNKTRKNYTNIGVENDTTKEIKDLTFRYIDFENTKNKIVFSNEYISIPKIIPFEFKSYEEFLNFRKHISARSESIIKAYVSILFYDFLED